MAKKDSRELWNSLPVLVYVHLVTRTGERRSGSLNMQ